MNKEKLTELVYINLGRASMCWSEIPRGVFDSTKAAELGKEIMEAIDEYVEAQEDKEPGWRDPMIDYLDWEERYNKSLQALNKKKEEREEKESEWQRRRRLEVMKELKNEEKRKFELDGPFKKVLEKVATSEVASWMEEYREEYSKLLKSGMFFEIYPELIGEWEEDKYAFCHDRKYKKK
jgi:hypothetical protein